MAVLSALQNAWRKNRSEICGLANGAIAEFVTARKPPDVLDGVPVFCSHLVEAEQFEGDLDFLARNGYRTVRGRDLLDHLSGRRVLPDRSVLLTFDDGPRNFHDVAFPLLARYRAHAISFIAPGLHAAAAEEENTEARPMTWEEIIRIHESGSVEFQSHTMESRFVPDWPTPMPLAGCKPALENSRRGKPLQLRDDLLRSRAMIEARLAGAAVNQLAFPMYLGTESSIEEARALGFEACYWGLLSGRPLNRPGDSPFHVSRMSDEFLRRLPGVGRISLRELLRVRIRRIRAAREWRQKFAG
jgi:peptidoglycan/xylan/chitin deacetylase (PgdA/CDA1 family)